MLDLIHTCTNRQYTAQEAANDFAFRQNRKAGKITTDVFQLVDGRDKYTIKLTVEGWGIYKSS